MPGPVSVEYGAELWPYDEAADQNPGGTIYDNRHTLGWPVDNAELRNTRMNLPRLRSPLAEGTGGAAEPPPPATVERSFSLAPTDPGTRAAGVWNTVLTVTGISRIAWVVQSGASAGWSFTTSPTEVAVPSNGQVAIAAGPNGTRGSVA